MTENKKIPNWIINSFNPGKEDEDYSFFVSTLAAFSFLGVVCLFKVIPFETTYILIGIVFILIYSAFSVWFCKWLAHRVESLKALRKGKQLEDETKTKKDAQKH
ncbi:hypothetical protein IKI14_06755 [bacterium]|nr:hypothetical protein [bacterium]